MNTKLIAGGALTGVVLAGMVSAQSVADATGLTEEQVIGIALMEVPGDVIEVEREREDGVQIYEIEILNAEGIALEVEIDAATGDILTVAADDADDECDKDDDTEDA